MKRNRKLAVVICICLILSLCLPFFLSGCRKKKIDSEMSVYYLNEDRTGLVKAPYETGKTAKQGWYWKAVRYGRGYTGNASETIG